LNQKIKKIVFFILGIFCLVLSYFGILLPGVPAIPFIILSGWFFIQSSDKIYNWMLKQRIIGKILKKYFSEDKTSIKVKLFIISQLWISLIIAQVFFINEFNHLIIINILGVIVSILLYLIL